MKIGILTYHCVTNFGAQLQTLSTVGYFKRHGHVPIVLNWFPQDLEEFYRKECPQEQYDEQYNFAQRCMPVSNLCRTLGDLNVEIDHQQLDAIFIGSDALFDYFPMSTRKYFDYRHLRMRSLNVTSNHDIPNPFWGSFDDGVKKKIPYCGFSISSQNSPYRKLNHSEIRELSRLLNNFSLISTRDEWTKKMVEYISGRNDVFITPDPVFAFNHNNEYVLSKEDLLMKYSLPEKYILISFYGKILSDEYINRLVSMIEAKTGIPCVSFPMPRRLRRFRTKYTIDLPLPTLDWYYLIKYSNGYIGELMHPIIVSIHNSIPFFCFDQYGITKTIIPKVWHRYIKESSKIYDILQRADMLDNVCPYFEIENLSIEKVVDIFMGFDKEKCATFANYQYSNYLSGMEKMLSSITI